MRALYSLIVTLALLGAVAPARAAAPVDRHATISQATNDVAAPSLHDALVAVPPLCFTQAPVIVFTALSSTPRPAPPAALPLYLRDRALLL